MIKKGTGETSCNAWVWFCVWSEGEFKLKQVQRRAKMGSLLDFILPLDNDG